MFTFVNSVGVGDRPPQGTANLVMMFDPALSTSSLKGPSGSLITGATISGSSGGPTKVKMPSVSSSIDFGVGSLNTLFCESQSFSVYIAVDLSNADLSGSGTFGYTYLIGEDSSVWRKWYVNLSVNGKVTGLVFLNGTATTYEYAITTTPISAGKHVIVYTYDKTKVFGSRSIIYDNGVIPTQTNPVVGGGVGEMKTGSVNMNSGCGQNFGFLTYPAVSNNGVIYIYSGAHTLAMVSQNSAWIRQYKKWQ